jgi:Helix-turn-helix domain
MSIAKNVSATLSPSFFADDRRQFWGQIFGHMIQNAREESGRSLEETAELAGMELTDWLAVEAGHVPSGTTWVRPMADALALSYDQISSMVVLCREAWEL